MARLSDVRLLALILDALRNQSRFDGYVRWEPLASDWMRNNLEAHTIQELNRLLLEHVEQGAEIDQVKEQRPEFASQYEFHYDFRLNVGEKHVYIETVLEETPTGPEIRVVNAHWK